MNALKVCCTVLAIQLSLMSCSNAQERSVTLDRPATRPVPLMIGVGVHFGIEGVPSFNYVADKTVKAMDELGVDSYRDDLLWSVFDPVGNGKGNGNGNGNGQPAKLFDLMRKARQTPLLVMGYPNPQVPDGNPPLTEQGRSRFAAFITQAVGATAPFKPIYEIWNEWNMNAKQGETTWLKGPGEAADARAAVNYAALAAMAVPAARAAAPGATVLAGAVGVDLDWSWTKAIVDGGATRDGAALSVHLYNQCASGPQTNRTATDLVDHLNQLQTVLGAASQPRPIYVTEVGWPTTAVPGCAVTRENAAANTAQFLFWAAATPWLKGAWIYQLKDQGTDPANLEHNFGLYDYNYAPKPAACAVREAIGLIRSSSGFALSRPLPHLFLLRAETPNGPRLIAWTTVTTANADLTVKGGTAKSARHLCSGPLGPERGGAYSVGAEPIVIDFDDAAPITVTVRQK